MNLVCAAASRCAWAVAWCATNQSRPAPAVAMTTAVAAANRRWRRVEGATGRPSPIGSDCPCAHPQSAVLNGLLTEPGFAQRPSRPGEAAGVPAVERQQRHAFAARLDEPAVAEVERRVIDLARLRAAAVRAEEHHVCGLQGRRRQKLRVGDLAAHLV